MSRLLASLTPVTLFCVLSAGCLALEKSLVFQPQRFPDGNWQFAEVPFEDAVFQSADGTCLHGWFAPVANPRAIVLYCHGNAGNVADCDWAIALFTQRLHCSILAFDYRGYGKSEGAPEEAGILADGRAARRWLACRTGVAEKDIVLVGRSLGGAVAIDMAAKDGAQALVLENTFTSLPDIAQYIAAPWPVRHLVGMQFNSLSLICHYRGPLLQTHGDADRLVPFEQGCRLFAAANQPKTFVTAACGGHNDLPTMEYVRILDGFLQSLPRPSIPIIHPTIKASAARVHSDQKLVIPKDVQ